MKRLICFSAVFLLVSPVAGTTRDSTDTPFEQNGEKYILELFRRLVKVVDPCQVPEEVVLERRLVRLSRQRVLSFAPLPISGALCC